MQLQPRMLRAQAQRQQQLHGVQQPAQHRGQWSCSFGAHACWVAPPQVKSQEWGQAPLKNHREQSSFSECP